MITHTLIHMLLGRFTHPDSARQAVLAGLQATIAGRVAQRIYLNHATQKDDAAANPYLVVRQVSGSHLRGLSGRAGQEDSLGQIDVYADTPANATVLASQIGGFLDGFRGKAGPGPSTNVQGVFQDDTGDNFLPPIAGDELGNPDVSLVFRVVQNE